MSNARRKLREHAFALVRGAEAAAPGRHGFRAILEPIRAIPAITEAKLLQLA